MDRFTVRLSSSHKPSGNTKPLVFKNPILTASGTFGYGVEFANYGDLTHLGGIVVKGLSLKPRPGNPLPRVAETPCGMLNAVGLQNDGVESFLKNKLPRLPWHETPVIANLYATSPAEFAELAGILPTSRHAKKTEQDCYPLCISHHSNHSHFFRISFYDPNGRLRTKIRNKTVSMLSITQLFSSLPSKEMQNSSQYSTGNY